MILALSVQSNDKFISEDIESNGELHILLCEKYCQRF